MFLCKCFNFEEHPAKIVYEGIDWLAIESLDHNAETNTIHILVISKVCNKSFLKLPYYNSIQLLQIMARISNQFKLEDYYVRVNEGKFQSIPHTHWHISNTEGKL